MFSSFTKPQPPNIVQIFNACVSKITSQFSFDRPVVCVGRYDEEIAQRLGHDPDIYNGTLISSQGFSRIALHIPTNSLCLIASKTPVNLRGVRSADGQIRATQDGLRKSYIISAYRLNPDNSNFQIIARQLRSDLRQYNERMHERSESHFTLFGFSLPEQHEDIFTNSRLAYIIRKNEQDAYKSRFFAPVADGSGVLMPIMFNPQRQAYGFFSRVSKIVHTATTYTLQRLAVARHWEKVASKLWDEENLFAAEGLLFNFKKAISDTAQFVAHHKVSMAVTAGIGAAMALVGNAVHEGVAFLRSPYGIAALLLGAAGHSSLHRLLDIGLHSSLHTMAKNKHRNMFQPIEAYGPNEDVADFFKVKTKTNILKLCPKMDMTDINPDDFIFQTSETSGMLADHQSVVDGMQPESLKGYLLAVHQRGFSSNCTLPDLSTRVDVFQSGLVRLMHQRQDGKTLIFARYRHELCLTEHMRLPSVYIDQLGEGIARMEYDRRASDFRNAFKISADPVSVDDMMRELSGHTGLFRNQPNASDEVRARSNMSIRDVFDRQVVPDDTALTSSLPNWIAQTLPDLRALTT